MKELALHIMDIAENSVNAGACRVEIGVEQRADGILVIRIVDDGKGMGADDLKKADDPFFTSRTTRKVGMGIPLLKQHAEMADGSFSISSEFGKGTKVVAVFKADHPDRQPIGDLEGVWLMLVQSFPGIEWVLECKSGKEEFTISNTEIINALEIEMIAGQELTGQLRRMIRNNIEELGIS